MLPLNKSLLINNYEFTLDNKLQATKKTSEIQKIAGTSESNKWSTLKKITFTAASIIPAGIVGYYVNSLRYESARTISETNPYENSKKDFDVIKIHQEILNLRTPPVSKVPSSPPFTPTLQNSSYEDNANISPLLPIAVTMAVVGLFVFFRKSIVNHVLKPLYESSRGVFSLEAHFESSENEFKVPNHIKKISKEENQPLNDPYEQFDLSKADDNSLSEFVDYHFSLLDSPDCDIELIEKRFNDLVKTAPEFARIFAIKCLKKPIESNLIVRQAFTIFIKLFNETYPNLFFINEHKSSQRLSNTSFKINAYPILYKCHSLLGNAFLFITECRGDSFLLMNNLLGIEVEDFKKIIDFLHHCDITLAREFVKLILITKNNVLLNSSDKDKISFIYNSVCKEFGITLKKNQRDINFPKPIAPLLLPIKKDIETDDTKYTFNLYIAEEKTSPKVQTFKENKSPAPEDLSSQHEDLIDFPVFEIK